MMRSTLRALAALAAATLATAPAVAQDKVKIGYAISKTGPNAGGATITQIPNYEMWVKDVNAKGGLFIGGKRLPIEVVWCEEFPFVHEAIEAERHLKGWSRAKKEALVMGDPTRLKALASRSRSPQKQHDRLHPSLRYPDPEDELD